MCDDGPEFRSYRKLSLTWENNVHCAKTRYFITGSLFITVAGNIAFSYYNLK